jgi:membrane peptidoglycan carboxypeptidase
MDNGPSKLVDMAEAAGIPQSRLESERNKPATVLGPDAYASPVDMASAYGTFANGGKHADLRVIKEVRDIHGKVLVADKAVVNQVIDEAVAANTTYALQKVVEKGTGRKVASQIGRPAAGKTGTAGGTSLETRLHNAECKRQGKTDPGDGCLKDEGADTLTSWWVGFTPQLSTAVLYRAGAKGESDLDPYSSNPAFFGGNWPARTWLAYMEKALENQPDEDFPQPSDENREITPTFTPTPTVETQTPTPTLTPSLPPTKPGRPKTTPPPTTTTTTTPHKPPKTTIPLPTSTTTTTPAQSP